MGHDTKTTIIGDMGRTLKKADSHDKRDASLIVIAGGCAGTLHKLPKSGDMFIGRAAESEICVEDEGVSRKHARIVVTPEQATLTDLGSTNGTYVNGEKVSEHVLRDGDKVQIGPHVILKFQYQDALEENFQRQMFENAVKDGLTCVYNKKYFLDRIETDFSYAKRHQTPLTLLMFDVDHFKKINDTHGHPAGDHVLRELAALIRGAIRSEDILARFGGEEFALLMRDVDDDKGLMLAERLRRLVEQARFVFGGKHIPVTVSIGIGTMGAAPDSQMRNSADLVNRADQYLYNAKRDGRNRVAGKASN